jgi:plastocyanin
LSCPLQIRCAAVVAAALGGATGIALAATTLAGTAQSASPAMQANANAVSIDNFTFTPQTLKVPAGSTVTWTNKDDIPHGIASENNAFARSKALDTDDSYSVTLTAPGTYKYFCYVHPHMTGTVIVEPSTR